MSKKRKYARDRDVERLTAIVCELVGKMQIMSTAMLTIESTVQGAAGGLAISNALQERESRAGQGETVNH